MQTQTRKLSLCWKRGEITVDGVVRRDYRFPVGLLDVLSIKDLNEHFRIVLDKKGKIMPIKIGEEERGIKLCKIMGKQMIKGKMQLNLDDGRNIFVKESSYKVGDAILLSFDKKNRNKRKGKLR